MNKKLLNYFSGELSPSEKYKFLLEVDNDESLKKDFVHFQNIYSIYQLTSHFSDKTEGKKSFDKFVLLLRRDKRRVKLRSFLKYAAVIVAVISSTIFGTLYLSDMFEDELYNTLYVPAGQRAQITLEDGTVVWLNAQSTLKYPSKFLKKMRKVEVEGEAFFDVAKDSKRPFVVNANLVNLEVLGTQFNIYSYSESNFSETTLVEGSLKVIDKLNVNNSVVLKPNEQVSYMNGKLSISPTSNADYFLWREGIYSFDNERLIDIMQKLELYYDITIEVKDPEIFNVTYTGKFRQRDGIDEILRILQIIQPFKIEKDKDNNRIKLSK
jgi:ferric-dicitrate binding protein FerR (iron transport regulator)